MSNNLIDNKAPEIVNNDDEDDKDDDDDEDEDHDERIDDKAKSDNSDGDDSAMTNPTAGKSRRPASNATKGRPKIIYKKTTNVRTYFIWPGLDFCTLMTQRTMT
jgi:hypothetical protein